MLTPQPPAPPAPRPPKSYAVAIVLNVFFGTFGVGEWYLGNRALAILLLCLFPFGVPGMWLGLLRAVILIFMGREDFAKRYGARGIDLDLLAGELSPWGGQIAQNSLNARSSSHTGAEYSDAPATTHWSYESEAYQALVAGHLSLDTYLANERRAGR